MADTLKYLKKWPNLKLEAHAVKSALSSGHITVYIRGRTDRIRPLLRKVGAKWIGIQRAWAMNTEAADELYEELDILEVGKTASYFRKDWGAVMGDQKIWKAAAKFDPRTVKKIEKMTDRNQHSEATIEGAKMLGYRNLVKKFELIHELHMLEGHLPKPLGDYRYSLYKELMDAAERDLSPEEYAQFHGAY